MDAPDPPAQTHSAYPSHPPPIPLHLVTTPDAPCPYLPRRVSRTRAFAADAFPAGTYHRFMDAAFRRSGRVFYQPVCPGCRQCVPLRVPVDRFVASKTQRRVWRRNADLAVTILAARPNAEKHALYERYRRHWHGTDEPESREAFASFLYDSPVDTFEIQYRDQNRKLLGVGIVDVCKKSLSSVYFFFEPDEASRSLGTYSALWEIEWAKRERIPHYYLGYWVAGCGAMQYKASFRPCELLGTDGVWREAEVRQGAKQPRSQEDGEQD